MYIVYVGLVKEDLHSDMQLQWERNSISQPPGFMNFPTQGNTMGLYTYENYFSHFEAEVRKTKRDKDGTAIVGYRWEKKNASVQNHHYDTYIYNRVVKYLILMIAGKFKNNKYYSWGDWVADYKEMVAKMSE